MKTASKADWPSIPPFWKDATEFVALAKQRGQDEAGEWVNTNTTRYVVKTFKHLAKKARALLAKGDRVIVAISIVTDTWADKESGENRFKQIVIVPFPLSDSPDTMKQSITSSEGKS